MQQPKTKKRFGCFRILLICGLLTIGLVAFWAWMNFTGGPIDGKPLVRVSPETTAITEPLDGNGDPDYITYLDRQYREGATPENNAAVLLLQAVGPTLEARQFGETYYQRLGIEPLKADGDYWIDFSEWKKKLFANDSELSSAERDQQLSDQYDFATKNPWAAEQFPELAQWLDQNSKPLELIRAATLRPRYYAPVFDNTEVPTVLGAGSELVHRNRELARALSISAMKHLGENDAVAAFSETLAIRRTARLTDQGPSLVDGFMAIALETLATEAELKIIVSGRATKQQLLDYRATIEQLPPLHRIYNRIDNAERFLVLDLMITFGRGELDHEKYMGSEGGIRLGLLGRMIFAYADWNTALTLTNDVFDRIVEATKQETFKLRKEAFTAIETEFEDVVTELLDAKVMAGIVFGGRRVRGKHAGKLMSALMLTPMFAALVAESRAIGMHRFSLIAISLELYKMDHGEYPRSLDELVPDYCESVPLDPFTEEPFHYTRKDKTYLLYSVGSNLCDDLGFGFDDIGSDGDDWSAKVTIVDWQQFQQDQLDRKEAERLELLELLRGEGDGLFPKE